MFCFFFFFNDTATTEIYTLSLHDALPIYLERVARAGDRQRGDQRRRPAVGDEGGGDQRPGVERSEEHTSELQSPCNLVCRLLLEKKKRSIHAIKHSIAYYTHTLPECEVLQ